MIDDDSAPETPSSVIASIAAGVAPLPFLMVYSVVFIGHGVFYPVEPPDITRTRSGEAVAGFLAVLVALVIILTIWWFLTGRRRWSFVLAQAAVLVTTIGFVADPKTGSATVPLVLIVTSLAALVFAFLPGSNEHMGSAWTRRLASRAQRLGPRRTYRGARRMPDAAAVPAKRSDVSVS